MRGLTPLGSGIWTNVRIIDKTTKWSNLSIAPGETGGFDDQRIAWTTPNGVEPFDYRMGNIGIEKSSTPFGVTGISGIGFPRVLPMAIERFDPVGVGKSKHVYGTATTEWSNLSVAPGETGGFDEHRMVWTTPNGVEPIS
ncbi:hypothetical protein [Rhodonellum sp.]|uniref:hypothetical protein n=1 Tax=Rhodonellum sp. TaxID=2231180 RepID=UPI00271CCB24|nr:hypothetical protein [Rhodonellum sp.]MDO9553862.1 hypothetical protein [Rhodonellum sp.]